MVTLALAGCTSTRQVTECADWTNPSSTKTTIRITRQSGAYGSGISIKIYDSGKEIGELGAGGTLCWERAAGGMLVRAKLSAMAGKETYSFYIPDTKQGKRHAYNMYFTPVFTGAYSGQDLWIEEVAIQ